MEAILIYNQCVSLNDPEKSTFTLEDGRCVTILGRASDDIRVPVTGKLLQVFQTCGVNYPPMVEIGDSLAGPRIILGFESFDIGSSSQKGYLRLLGLPFLIHPLCNAENPLKGHNVSLRVGIEMLSDDVSNCSFTPDVISHVFEMHMGRDLDGRCSELTPFQSFKHDACVTLKSAQNSTVNVLPLLQNWTRSGSNWKLTMSLFLIVTPNSATDRPDPDVSDHLIPNKRMRTDETFADFTIITGNKTLVKCHRAVLAAQSPYFARMFEPGTIEARSGKIETPLISTEGVGAMLDYFYTWNIAVLEVNPIICVELLKAGHQYDIEALQKCTKKILLHKDSNWYSPESALQLLLFMKDMDMADLKLKAVKVCKMRFLEIQKLSDYEQLVRNREVMKQVFEYVLTV